ncbi:hypothetical protein [Bradyrhizobium genosp. P]|uniref:DUF3024 domain-containing protein n=1 Tax=Bradyrhizobium genosp. P TaxID=83641 RepID=UPI003CEB9800
MNAAVIRNRTIGPKPHPNELDRKRIEQALSARKRYRWVSPHVEPLTSGYLVASPCCSRNIDTEGGLVDVALIHYDRLSAIWKLFRKDHALGIWEFHSVHLRLGAVTDEINADLDKVFWQ